MKVEWKDIEGIPGYQISSDGRVKSVERIIPRGANFLPIKERILKPWKRSKDYLSVGFRTNGQHKAYTVHRLVACTFIPNPENKKEINHIDGNKENNSVENLEWVTPSENAIHAFQNALRKPIASKMVIVETVDGEVIKFNSMKDCSLYFGFCRDWVKGRIRNKGNPFKYNGNTITKIDEVKK